MPKIRQTLSRQRKHQLIKKELAAYELSINESKKTDNEFSLSISQSAPIVENVHIQDNFNNGFDRVTFSPPHAPSPPITGSLQLEEHFRIDEHNTTFLEGGGFSKAEASLAGELRVWISDQNISKQSVNSLLKILRKHGHSDELPQDYRALLQTPRCTSDKIDTTNGGYYVHFGLAETLKRELKKASDTFPKKIDMYINCDGLSVASSSRSEMWPILVSICFNGKRAGPAAVGIHWGTSKPTSPHKYLEKFISELKTVLNNGLHSNGSVCNVNLKAVVCDTLGRSFVTCTKGHSAYFGCTKCTEKGEWCVNHVVLPNLNAPLRSDESFRMKLQPEHHSDVSPLEALPINMVTQNALDYMHLVCLGVMKRMVEEWMDRTNGVRLNSTSKKLIEQRILQLRSCIPSEFSRKPRPLAYFRIYKATEFRLFLLYTGPVILKGILDDNLYKNFLTLSIAIRILCEPELCIALNDYANSLLHTFVENYIVLYGLKSMTFNIHNLIHIADDVKNMGCLDSFSCFCFENFLKTLKAKIKTAANPLHQVVNRLYEEFSLPPQTAEYKCFPIVHRTNQDQIKKIDFEAFSITAKSPDRCFMSANNDIMLSERVYELNGEIFIDGKMITVNEPLFKEPCISSTFHVYLNQISTAVNFEKLPLTSVKKKCLELPHSTDDFFVSVPLIHH